MSLARWMLVSVTVAGTLFTPRVLPAQPAPEVSARAAFEANLRLAEQYDPAAAELYADEATIRNVRRYPNGQARELSLAGRQYKEMIRSAMPLAKARNDRSDYENCTYRADGEAVRVECQRYSHLKNYTSPYRAVLRPAR